MVCAAVCCVWEPYRSRWVPSDFSEHWAAPDTCHVREHAIDRLLVVPVVDVGADLNSGGHLRGDVPVFGGVNLMLGFLRRISVF